MTRDRLESLTENNRQRGSFNPRYSKFVRWLRLVLPAVALIIIAIVFLWGSMMQETVVPLKEGEMRAQSVGMNELIKPHFESRDQKNQSYSITAGRALQGAEDENLVILEEPMADMVLNSGDLITIRSAQGAFRQDNQRLLLKGEVQLSHDGGYQLDTQELHIDLEKNQAWSDVDVHAQGPEGTLVAKGLRADTVSQNLIFNGPAKMTLVSGDLGDFLGAPSGKGGEQ